MKCPYCSTLETKVIDSRLNQLGDITRRRRECIHCEGRFTTYERVEEVMPVVIKKDGRRETYDRQKILEGVRKSCQKRSIPIEKIDEVVNRIEARVQSFGLKEGSIRIYALHMYEKLGWVRGSSRMLTLWAIANRERLGLDLPTAEQFEGA